MSNRRAQAERFRPKLIALSVAACFSLSTSQTQANPTGGTVTSGSASFASSGNALTVTNTANTIINWASFSIGVNEITRFLQSSASSAVLNRVVGANGVIPQSVIDGILSSNGRVFLLNQSGILIGSTARIDVAGFVASSLNLTDQDFLNGRLRFTETPGAGGVSNAGVIDTSAGGRVFLVAPDVQNSGIIRSPQGEIVLAAGKSVELVSEGSPFVTVNITADSEQALNVGQLISDSGRTGMFGALVRQGGVVEANGAVAGANGEIRLVATKDLTLDAGSRTTANGASGGSVLLQAQGGTNIISGAVEAKGDSGQGGTIQALGVRVGVIGSGVIDASGDAGGGTVLVGGDAHGANPNVQNADRTLIGPDGVIRADAGTTGDGGRVIVWADGDTRFYGSISAQGGAQSGNGGFVETSGKLGLDIQGGRIDARAPNGRWGTWLLDPVDVTIIYGVASAPGTDPAVGIAANIGVDNFAAAPVYGGLVTSGTLETNFLNVGSTQIQATNNVNFKSDLTMLYGGGTTQNFIVRAGNNIDLAADGTPHTIATNGHNVILSANDTTNPQAPLFELSPTGAGSIVGKGIISTAYGGAAGGNIILSAYGVDVGNLDTRGTLPLRGLQSGSVTITALYGGVQTGTITTRGDDGADFNAGQVTPPVAGGYGGNVTISAAYGSVTTGNIDASGGRGGNGGYANAVLFDGASGGYGGLVTIGDGTTTSIATGAITANGGAGGYGGSGGIVGSTATLLQTGYGGLGGNGGIVSLVSGGNVTTGAITLSGAAGGAGGSNIDATVTGVPVGVAVYGSVEVGFGGDGGSGGSATITGGDISTGTIVTTGGAGGAGGSGDRATANVTATTGLTTATGDAASGTGGNGGSGSLVQINATGSIAVAGIASGGGIAGAGGSGGSATANSSAVAEGATANAQGGSGGNGGIAGSIVIASGAYGNITIGDISSPGGTGGAAGDNSASTSAISSSTVYGASATTGIGNGGNAGSSSSVDITGGSYGTVTIGTISTNGGAGGIANGGGGAQAFASSPANAASAVVKLGSGGSGGSGGFVGISGDTVSTLAINTSSGSGADGAGAAYASATGTGSLVTTSVFFGGGGGAGIGGGDVTITGTGSVTTQGINASSGSGGNGAGASGANGYGGDGGFSGVGGFVTIDGGTSVATGSITTRGGNGGNGGATTATAGLGGAGGDGAEGGSISLAAPVSVTVAGAIDATGGSGGAGGSSVAGYGGQGGAGGSNSLVAITIDPDTASVGSISAAGGAGGNGGDGGIQGGAGGAGGAGAYAAISSLTYGVLTVGNIDVSGASGGAGGSSAGAGFYGGAGGDGGYGGFAIVFGGSINLLSGGTILAKGGGGGAGGAAGAAFGGNGGIGGNGGLVELFAESAAGAYGTLQVGALNFDVTGGAGGAGGAGGGLAGANGLDGTIFIFGNLPTAAPIDASVPVVSGLNSLFNTAPSTDEIEKKNKESKEKKAAVCK